MSQKYKDKYEELRNNDLGTKKSNQDLNLKEDDSYATPGNVRNLGFVWEDGRRMFLNYAYLVSVELSVSQDLNIITLYFASHILTINGYKLDKIYEYLFLQTIRTIELSNERYVTDNIESPIIKEITIQYSKA